MSEEKPRMHCQEELEADLGYPGYLPDHILWKWFQDRYSTSKHLLTLYSVVRGLSAKTIVEVGFGRSSFMLARAAAENGGRYIVCDQRDFSYLLNEAEKKVTTYVQGWSHDLWSQVKEGADFIFLDYFGTPEFTEKFCRQELENALRHLKTNGILAVHDTNEPGNAIYRAVPQLNPPAWARWLQADRVQWVTLPYNYGLGLIRKLEQCPWGTVTDQHHKKAEL